MASSSAGNSIPAPEAVQVLVSSLADESPMVREASMAALKDIAPLNPLLVLDSCSIVSRGGRRRFGNIAGLFQVMSVAIRALDKRDVEPSYVTKLAKIATAELISSKEFNADWQRAAASVLVAIGLHLPDLMMEEVFLHLSETSSSIPAMVQVLADFASVDALQFTPRLKAVLARVLPILGNVRDINRPIFSNAFKCWCQACWQYSVDYNPIFSVIDGDVMSFLNSAFELLLRVWAASRDLKVRSATVEALGQMVGLITRAQLKMALPRLVPTILDMYKKDQDMALVATCTLHNLLNASLLSESGPPLLDFEDVTVILSTLLPVVCISNDSKELLDFSVGLKKCRLKEEPLTFGSISVLKHLLPRLSEAWHSRRPSLVEAVKLLLDEHSWGVRKALAELIVVMASHCYLIGPSGELFVEFLVRNCAIEDSVNYKEVVRPSGAHYSFLYKKLEVRDGAFCPMELRSICEKGLLLITVTIPEMEVCKCISELCRHRSSQSSTMLSECKARADIPPPEELFARLVVLLHNSLARDQLATQILTVN